MADKPAQSAPPSPPPSPATAPPAPPSPAAPPQAAQPAAGHPPEEKVLSKDEARALFEGGHRLKKKGDPNEKWLAATRLHGQLCLAQPVTEELEKSVLEAQLVLIPD